jgi:hypothetical protein
MNLTTFFPELYRTFNAIFVDIISYFSLFFISSAVILIDNGIHLTRHEIKAIIDLKEKEDSKRLMYLIQNDKAIQRRRLTSFTSKLLEKIIDF